MQLHFSLLCPVYKEQRTILLGTIKDIINSITNTYGVIIDCNTSGALLDLFLNSFNVPQHKGFNRKTGQIFTVQ